jgi:hypothetical protein
MAPALIEGGAVDGLDRHRRFRIVAIDDRAVALDGFHNMGRRCRSTKFNVIVNLQTAKALGITLPTSILLRADEVIE